MPHVNIMSTSITEYRKAETNMEKKGMAKYKRVNKKKNKSTANVEVSDTIDPSAPKEAAAIVYEAVSLNANTVQDEPLVLLEDTGIYDMMCEMVALEEKKARCEYVINQSVIQKFNELAVNLDDVVEQVDVVRNNIKDLRTLSGMVGVLKYYGVNLVYKNPVTGYRLPLDSRLGKLVYNLAEALMIQYAEEKKEAETMFVQTCKDVHQLTVN